MTPATYVDILRARAASQPDRLAYRFLLDGEADERTLTYGQLHDRATAVASQLLARGHTGQPVLLILPPGLEFVSAFLGSLLAGAIAVPVPVGSSGPKATRLHAVAADVKASLAITTAALQAKLDRWYADLPQLARIPCVIVDDEAGAVDHGDAASIHVDADAPAFVQYTSGSTDTPKGIVITHRNLMENSGAMARAFGYSAESHCFTWLPPYHDMGLIGGILQPLHGGFPCTMMSPASFLQAPHRWLRGITRYRATVSGGPNFAYDLCATRIRSELLQDLDLRSWSVAFNGAEPVRADTLDRFAAAFADRGFDRRAFMPCYGLAEATLFVTGGVPGRDPIVRTFDSGSIQRSQLLPARADAATRDVRRLVGVGSPGDDVIVVDPVSRSVTDGIGEIWIDAARCARGYWNRPDATAETFGAAAIDKPGEYLRTGDLGGVVDGQLFIAGRLKDVIVIRGLKFHPQDIERSVESADAVLRRGCGVAFGIEVDGGERLVIVQELERSAGSVDLAAVIARIRRRVSDDHALPPHAVVLVPAGTVPKTSSGKLQRRACRALYETARLPIELEWRESAAASPAAPDAPPAILDRDAPDDRWLALFADFLAMPRKDVRADLSVASLCLDSLRAAELIHHIEARTAASLPLSRLFDEVTIGNLIADLRARAGATHASRAAIATDGPEATAYPLTWGQRSLQAARALSLATGGPDINVAVAFRARGTFDLDAFERAWNRVIARHPVLRSVFDDDGSGATQRVRDAVTISIERIDATDGDEQAFQRVLSEVAYRPFDLRRECPVRVAALHRAGGPVVVVAANHVAVDFWSLSLIFNELQACYRPEAEAVGSAGSASDLPAVSARYSDYVRGEQQWIDGEEGERLARYWTDTLQSADAPLTLCADRPRPAVRTFWGESLPVTIGRETLGRLRQLARMHDTTVYGVLLAAFQALLLRCSGQERVSVIAPVAVGRERWADTVGYFVNPLVLRADRAGQPSFQQIVVSVRRTLLDALAHRAYPFPLLVNRVQPEPDLSRPPLAQAMCLLYRTLRHDAFDLARLAVPSANAMVPFADAMLEPVPLTRQMTQYDVALIMAEGDQGLAGQLEYNAALFDRGTMAWLAHGLEQTLDAATAAPDVPLDDLPLLGSARRAQIVSGWNDTFVDFGRRDVLHALVEEQVDRTPQAPAVICGAAHLTYRELDDVANGLARRLREAAIGAESLVGVYMERSLEMLVALLAVLKAGGAYVPLDPDAPRERSAAVVKGADIRLVLTQAALGAVPIDGVSAWWPIDVATERLAVRSSASSVSTAGGVNLAYVIFTSGSTGEPKGVMNTHRGICNRLLWMQSAYALRADDRILQKTPFTFDVSIWELFWPLIAGAAVVVAPPGSHRDPAVLAQVIDAERVTTVHFVPSMLKPFLDAARPSGCASLQRVICSGEALSVDLQQQCFATLSADLHNLYGPTEVAVDVTSWACERNGASGRVPIGRPIANTQVYVLDRRLEPVPPGVAGSLYLGGVGVARGYVRQPAMTASRFIPDPFSTVPGARLFASGDLGRLLPNGAIEYLGRSDDQVKVRGARVELGDIEATIVRHADVREAVVVARPHRDEIRLIAYVLPHDGRQLAPADLRRWIRAKLPDYMVPARFVVLDRMPVTAHGKLDRQALPEPDDERSMVEAPFVAPRTPAEEELAALWIEVLGVSEVGVHDSFFDLGGHSLALMQLVNRVRDVFGVDLPLPVYVETPTVAEIAAAISAAMESRHADLAAPAAAAAGIAATTT